MFDKGSRKRRYERALRWYPVEWRQQHGFALVGDLMDQDDARGRQDLAAADRLSLFFHGSKTRALRRATPAGPAVALRLIGLTGCLLAVIFYWTTDATDFVGTLPAGAGFIPSHEPKTFIDNGASAPTLLLALGLVATIARREALARICGALGALAALVVTQLAVGTLNGPDGPVGATLVVFGVMAAAPARRWSAVVGFLALIAGTSLLETSLAMSSSAPAYAAGVCFTAAAVVGALALRRKQSTPDDSPAVTS